MNSSTFEIKYYSLDEARIEIRKRWSDEVLRANVENVLGDKILPGYKFSPKATIWKATISPDNTFTFFMACAAYLNVEPLFLEHHNDKFTSLNEEKRNLGRLFLNQEGKNRVYDICNIQENENKQICDVTLRNGESLVSFYNKLYDFSGYNCMRLDVSNWAKSHGTASDYYYNYLLHFICHGAVFEIFLSDDEDKREVSFTNEVIIPSIKKIKNKFGLDPILLKPYPDHQDAKEDHYWWAFNPTINKHLLDMCVLNNFNLRK